jgi:hypothetical protein
MQTDLIFVPPFDTVYSKRWAISSAHPWMHTYPVLKARSKWVEHIYCVFPIMEPLKWYVGNKRLRTTHLFRPHILPTDNIPDDLEEAVVTVLNNRRKALEETIGGIKTSEHFPTDK